MVQPSKILITGGAGFIGSNLADCLIGQGHQVTLFDNLSRSGCKTNVEWLSKKYGRDQFSLIVEDITNFDALLRASEGVDRVYHLAGQVAVTTSVQDPRKDFVDNALGTFNALEAARLAGNNPVFLFSSTNKVYGGMDDLSVIEKEARYEYDGLPFGISEERALDFHSPYGCSKGTGDQYTRDYFRIYGLRTIVVRQSCIYGYRQFGVEDQGWVAWFIIAALKNRPISIYGSGKQVRDILFVEDLISFYERAVENIDKSAGQVFNVGGGINNTISIWTEFLPILEELLGRTIPVKFANWRPGDQLVYISDIRKAEKILGWQPMISVKQGISCLFNWVQNDLDLFEHL